MMTLLANANTDVIDIAFLALAFIAGWGFGYIMGASNPYKLKD